MDRIPGMPLEDRWRTMTWSAKETLVKHVASFAAVMFHARFRGIGSLSPGSKDIASTGYVEYLRNGPQASSGDTANVHRQSQNLPVLNPQDSTRSPIIGRIVSMEFFWGSRNSQKANGEPF